MPELIAPTTRLHAEWLDAHDEWGPGVHEDGFGLRPSDDVHSNTASSKTIARLGGVPEGIQETGHGTVRRYWITLQPDPGSLTAEPSAT